MTTLPGFFLPKRKHFGLSIGRMSIRAVEMDGRKVRSAVEVPLPEGIFADGVLIKQEEFVSLLKKLVVQGKFATEYIAVCFSEIYAFSREYSLPIIPQEEISEAISWHVKELFPFPESEIYYDWKVLETHTQNYDLSVVAVQKKILDPIVAAIKDAGLKPLSFEPGAAAIAGLLMLKQHEQAYLVEINRIGAYVTLVEGEKALFTTVVPYRVQETVETYLEYIKQTLVEINAYYQKKGILQPVKLQIILSGELATEEWAKRLSVSSNCPVRILKTQIPNPAFNKAYAVANSRIVPPQDPNSINLLPASLQTYYEHEQNQLFFRKLWLRVCFVMAILFSASLSVYLLIAWERQRLEQQVKLLSQTLRNQQPDTQNLLLLNSNAKNIVALSPLRLTPQDKLQVIQSLLSAGITVNQWEYDDSKLLFTLTGIAKQREDLLVFKNKLEKSAEFAKITLPLGFLETPENIHFSINFISKK